MLRRSKTDQLGKGRKVQLYSITGSPLCPVDLVRRFLTVRLDVGGPLLVHAEGTPLTRFQFVAVFRKCLITLGLGHAEFSIHSFCIGAATEAVRWGLDDVAVGIAAVPVVCSSPPMSK